MRFMLGTVLLLVVGLIPTNKASAAVVGTTQVLIGAVSIDANNVTVNFTMELDSTTKSFGGALATTKETGFFGSSMPTYVNWAVSPTPGGGAVNATATFVGKKGTEYKIDISMMYLDATNTMQTTVATKTFTP